MASTGDRIKEIREELEFTQEVLAKKASISVGFLSEIENNKRNTSSEVLLKIANALGASVDYLLGATSSYSATSDGPIEIPHHLSIAAEELDLSYGQTLELLDAYRSVAARRTKKATRVFSVEDWKNLHKSLLKVFG